MQYSIVIGSILDQCSAPANIKLANESNIDQCSAGNEK